MCISIKKVEILFLNVNRYIINSQLFYCFKIFISALFRLYFLNFIETLFLLLVHNDLNDLINFQYYNC